jgi:hypothetical protein
VEIAESARRRGIDTEDILHAWDNAIRYVEFDYEGEDRLLVIGGDRRTAACSSWSPCPPKSRRRSSTLTDCGQSSTST